MNSTCCANTATNVFYNHTGLFITAQQINEIQYEDSLLPRFGSGKKIHYVSVDISEHNFVVLEDNGTYTVYHSWANRFTLDQWLNKTIEGQCSYFNKYDTIMNSDTFNRFISEYGIAPEYCYSIYSVDL
jgi:RIO-like serine/threonine protein kinase